MADAKTESKVSFGFLKKKDKLFSNVEENVVKTDYVLSVEKNKIKSTEVKEEKKKDLVIPLSLQSGWKTFDVNDESLEAKAAKEIIEETRKRNEQIASKCKNDGKVIPLFLQNRFAETFETKDKLDVSLRPDKPTLEDYEEVPVEGFGLAMLRGMGWKEGCAIGKTNKSICKPIEPSIRPKGLGLGADRTTADALARLDVDEENKPFAKGSYVFIQHGSYKGSYGKIEGNDEDTVRFEIQLAIGGERVSVSQYSVVQVPESEYKEKGKVLNREKYEQYKMKIEEEQNQQKEKKKHSSRNQSPTRDSIKSKHKKRKHHDSDSSADSKSHKKHSKQLWVRPNLRVRFIDKGYKHGRYFNTKFCIVDVASINSCVCKTDDGKLIDGVSQKSFETVIPRTNPAYVMVVKGVNVGELGEIIERDKWKCVAEVQLLKSKSIIRIDYDSICEYIGDITAEDDY